MIKNVLATALAVFVFSGCQVGNLGFYLYPQAASTGIAEVPSQGPLGGLEVVGYLPAHKIPRVHATQARHLTDLVYFTLGARADGTLAKAALVDSHRDFLKKVRREYGLKVLIGVTDHSARGPLAKVAANPVLREKFAADLTNFLIEEEFDGADFDWEYPTTLQMDSYAALLQAVRTQFSPRGLKLTVAVSPSRPLSVAAYAAVDRVHGMLYDDVGRHSTLEKVEGQVDHLIARGVEPSKLLLGVPFYGRGYTRSGPAWSSALSYKALRERYELEPDQDTVSGYYFNGIETVQKKVEFAKDAGLAGVMVWEIGQDTEDEASLLAAITQARRELSHLN